MKKTFIFAAAAALSIFASCQKEEIEAPSTDSNGDLVFTATIASQDSKTTINAISGKVAWVIGDTITIKDCESTEAKYSVTAMEGDTLAIFTKVKGEPKLGDGTYTAVYGTDPAEEQTYSATVPALPMSASSETTRLKFTVSCGLLELYLKAGEKVTGIDVKGMPTKTVGVTYSLNCPEPVDIAEGDTFYVALPEGSYWDILIKGEHGAECTKSGSGIDIKANHITPVSFSKPLHFMVQLWEDGPYFATTNIGAADSTETGQYFAWGYPEGCVRNSAGNGWVLASDKTTVKEFSTSYFPDVTTSPLDTTNDMAAKNWGKEWSVPTKEDLDNLLSDTKTEIEYITTGTKGIRVKGLGDYASHSIFLPAAGFGEGSTLSSAGDYGSYWSSVPSGSAGAYDLYFYPGNGSSGVLNDYEYYGLSVRPVHRPAPDPVHIYPEAKDLACVKIGNVWWAPVNCGYTSELTYGKLYQFGRKVGTTYGNSWTLPSPHDAESNPQSYETTNPTTTNPDDSKFYKGDDIYDWYTSHNLPSWPMKSGDTGYLSGKIDNPCPEGWRVPTKDELTALKNADFSWVTNKDITGKNEGSYNGGLFGTSPNQVFLPAAGCRDCADGSAYSRGEYGYYWSSSVNDSKVCCMYYSSTGGKQMYEDYRANGNSVRCVQE